MQCLHDASFHVEYTWTTQHAVVVYKRTLGKGSYGVNRVVVPEYQDARHTGGWHMNMWAHHGVDEQRIATKQTLCDVAQCNSALLHLFSIARRRLDVDQSFDIADHCG